MARIERDWLSIEMEVSAMFDNVNSLVARLAKRQKREKPSVDAEAIPPAPALNSSKLDIRHRIRERQGASSRVAVATPPDHQEQS